MRRLIVWAVLVFALHPDLQAQTTEQLTEAVKQRYQADGTLRFLHAYADLDDDGIEDAIVLIKEPDWCGSDGCFMGIFRGTKTGFTFVSSSTITNPPIRVSTEKSSGWKTLIVYAKGVGDVLMRFDGKRYPVNPAIQAKATLAQTNAARAVLKSFPPMSFWEYTEAVEYRSWHEPSFISLHDGRTISYEPLGSFTSTDLQNWSRGKPLVLAYSQDYGTALVDPETQDTTSIRFVTNDHPIDRITNQCLEKNSTTVAMVDCYAKAQSMWDKELNRLYNELMNRLSPEQKLTLQTAQREWIQYRDAQKAAIVAIYNEGSISGLERAIAITRLTKEQTQKVGQFLNK